MVLQVITTALFNRSTWIGSLLALLTMYGNCMILKKCGVKKYMHGAIPIYGDLLLARAAARDDDGQVYYCLNLLARIVGIVSVLVAAKVTEPTAIFFTALLIIVMLTEAVYHARILGGVCDLFNKRKKWILLLLPMDWLFLPLWGLREKYQPVWQMQEVDEEVSEFFSSGNVSVMSEGLSISLHDRTAKELFRKKVLLRGIHMYIKPGSMVLLLGGSGAGKTTLVNAINGYEKANAEVHLNGGNVYHDYKRMQYDIGFVPQLDLMRGSDTVLHTLLDAATLRLPSEMNGAMRRERVETVMGIFGLKPVEKNMVSKLSGGQRKRLSIAMEFLSNPELFILDEPDSGLDGVMARELMEQLRKIADQGKIVIVITHTPDRVIDLFDDVIVLAKDKYRTGRLAYYGPITQAKEFFRKDTMEHIVLSINRKEEGGEGRADEFVEKYAEVMKNV